jgi:hypothetical protein
LACLHRWPNDGEILLHKYTSPQAENSSILYLLHVSIACQFMTQSVLIICSPICGVSMVLLLGCKLRFETTVLSFQGRPRGTRAIFFYKKKKKKKKQEAGGRRAGLGLVATSAVDQTH